MVNSNLKKIIEYSIDLVELTIDNLLVKIFKNLSYNPFFDHKVIVGHKMWAPSSG